MSADYRAFLGSKAVAAPPVGFAVAPAALNPALFHFQRDIVAWALERGRAALFEERGLGKTAQQLAWAAEICRHTGRDVLIFAPLVVAAQTAGEGEKFGIPVTVCRDAADVRPGINIANYERLHLFEPSRFVGAVADESSIVKSYTGVTKRRLVEWFGRVDYGLACTATPSPNDTLELGNHAELLRVMSSHEMIARWFVADQSAMGTYRLKKHGAADFWRWVATWAVALRRPSDLGYADDGYDLPPLVTHNLTVEVDISTDTAGRIFRSPDLNATGLHREGRRTAAARAAAVAELVNAPERGGRECWAVWCNTDYEADELLARIPDAVEVRGPQPVEVKEARLTAFTRGQVRVLITKPRIAGFGLNWQHCAHTAFVGLSYSFEQLHQALGRLHRFGQAREVHAWIVAASTEGAVWAAVRRKQEEHERLQEAMVRAARELHAAPDAARRARYDPRRTIAVPRWLHDHTEARP